MKSPGTEGTRRRVVATGLGAASIVVVMLGLTAAAVPLYALFCEATGFGGTTRRAQAAPAVAQGPMVTVFFDAAVDEHLPWRFKPVQRSMEVRVGEQQLAFFEAENTAAEPVVGRATFNVTPHKVGSYFVKLACFCFERQILDAGQRVSMPVSFYVDPAMLDDAASREVRQITLSYTFFIDAEGTAALRKKRPTSSQS